MKTLCLSIAILVAAPVTAQVHVQVQLPSIVFPAPPPLVVIEPGIQVVEDYDDEVFFVDNFYWYRRGPHWYRTPTHNGTWVVVDQHHVPGKLVKFRPGQYRKFRGHGHGGHGAVIINPPGPGKVKIKGGKHKGGKHDD